MVKQQRKTSTRILILVGKVLIVVVLSKMVGPFVWKGYLLGNIVVDHIRGIWSNRTVKVG